MADLEGGTGIVTHIERAQPYTVWVNHHVVLFTDSLERAESALRYAKTRPNA